MAHSLGKYRLFVHSVDLICKYLEDIFPAYNQLACEKEIRCEYSFDFDSRFYSDARLNTFVTQYNKMRDKIRDVYAKDYKISSNHFASILLPKTVRFINENWNNCDNSIIKFIKDALADGADLNFCLPFPMPLTVLQKLKNSYNFCDNYCYLTVEELRKFNDNLGIDGCPFIPQTIDNTELFYCDLNNGCPQKLYCKRYLLRNTNVNM